MSLITVKTGAKAGAFGGEDGVHPATLVSVEGPKTITPKDGGDPYDIFEWTFAVDGAPDDACLVWASSSTATGPRSKMYGFLTALLGGRPPAVGQAFDAEDLVGRMALITIRRDEDGWTRVDNMSALPVRTQAPPAGPAPVPAPAPSPRPAPRVVGRPTPVASVLPTPVARTLRDEVLQPAEPVGDDGIPF